MPEVSVLREQVNSFLDDSIDELKNLFREKGIPDFRIAQIRNWIFAKKVDQFDRMNNLSRELRETLQEIFEQNSSGNAADSLFSGSLVHVNESEDRTQKMLLRFPDGHQVECVLLRDDRNHRTGCISTQIGCAMGCMFCASGMDGFVRNLSKGEILEQILRLNQRLEKDERLTHLVIMGTGEPLLNLGSLLQALEEAVSPQGLGLSARRITISTVGIPDAMERLARCGHPYKLAVSLHAPNDEIRSRIVPRNRVSGIRDILEAADLYFQKSGRRVTFEYVMIRNVNDRPEHARELSKLLRKKTAIVNIIPYNPISELSFQSPSLHVIREFVSILQSAAVPVKVRFRKGDQIDAACGQLRRRFSNEHSPENAGSTIRPKDS